MYEKLRKFQGDRDSGTTLSTFADRFRFLRREKDRETCLKNLQTWNKRIAIVIGPACEAAESQKAVSAPIVSPHTASSLQLRKLSRRLFDALRRYWVCPCDVRHEARFSLASCGRSENCAMSDRISFDFLITASRQHQDASWQWREGTIEIRKTR